MDAMRQTQQGDKPSVPVCLIHWNAPQWLASSIESISDSQGCRPTIFVVDNSLRLDQGDLPDGVRLVTPKRNLGYSGGANLGLAEMMQAQPEASHLVIASHDAHVEPHTLRRLRDTAVADPSVGVVAPSLTRPAISFGGSWDGRKATMITDRDLAHTAVWASGTLLMLAAECVADIDGFDEAFSSYCEDVDLCLRAADHGWGTTVVPDAIAWGIGSASDSVATTISINTSRLRIKRDGPSGLGQVLSERTKSLAGAVSVWAGRGRQSAESRKRAGRSALRQTREFTKVMGSATRWLHARKVNGPNQPARSSERQGAREFAKSTAEVTTC